MVHGKLTLIESKTRRVANRAEGPGEDGRLPESIVTSRGQEDTGTFGGQDGRYQPFEYRGAVDTLWKLELLDRDMPTFDHRSITDVNLMIAFTARDGGEVIAGEVRAALPGALSESGAGFGADAVFEGPAVPNDDPPLVVVSAFRDFPDAWHAFHHPDPEATEQTFAFDLEQALLAFAHRTHGVQIHAIEVVMVTALEDPELSDDAFVSVHIDEAIVGSGSAELEKEGFLGQIAGALTDGVNEPPSGVLSFTFSSADIAKFPESIREKVSEDPDNWRFKPGGLRDVLVILRYTLTS